MAASTVAGGIFNAFAFAGASWIMSHVDHGNYQAEQKRHDMAVEKLQKDQELWEREETKMRDELEKRKLEEQQANQDLGDADKSLEQYYKLTHQYQTHLRKKPTLNYTPSPEFQKYLSFFKISIIAGGVVIVTRYVI